jgi:hypothetical protein
MRARGDHFRRDLIARRNGAVRAAHQCPKCRPQLLDLGGRTHCILARDQRLLGRALERSTQACGVVGDSSLCSGVRPIELVPVPTSNCPFLACCIGLDMQRAGGGDPLATSSAGSFHGTVAMPASVRAARMTFDMACSPSWRLTAVLLKEDQAARRFIRARRSQPASEKNFADCE